MIFNGFFYKQLIKFYSNRGSWNSRNWHYLSNFYRRKYSRRLDSFCTLHAFQWCVGGQCVGNVPIYAHQSFSKPNTEKWTKGQDFSDTPFFAIIRFSTILIGTSIQWKAEVLRMFLLALECFQLSAIPGTKRYFM